MRETESARESVGIEQYQRPSVNAGIEQEIQRTTEAFKKRDFSAAGAALFDVKEHSANQTEWKANLARINGDLEKSGILKDNKNNDCKIVDIGTNSKNQNYLALSCDAGRGKSGKAAVLLGDIKRSDKPEVAAVAQNAVDAAPVRSDRAPIKDPVTGEVTPPVDQIPAKDKPVVPLEQPVVPPVLDENGQPIVTPGLRPGEKIPRPRARPPEAEGGDEDESPRRRGGKKQGGKRGGGKAGGSRARRHNAGRKSKGGDAPAKRETGEEEEVETPPEAAVQPEGEQPGKQPIDNLPTRNLALPENLERVHRTIGNSPAQHTKEENAQAILAQSTKLTYDRGGNEQAARVMGHALMTAAAVETYSTNNIADPNDKTFNNRAVGDRNTSHGFFQLHTGGQGTDNIINGRHVTEPLSKEERFTPNIATERALNHMEKKLNKMGYTIADLGNMPEAEADKIAHSAIMKSQAASDRRYGHKYDRALPQVKEYAQTLGFETIIAGAPDGDRTRLATKKR